jgi:hypothetical protein
MLLLLLLSCGRMSMTALRRQEKHDVHDKGVTNRHTAAGDDIFTMPLLALQPFMIGGSMIPT